MKLTHWMILKMDLETEVRTLYKTRLTLPNAKKILKGLALKNKTKVVDDIGVLTATHYYGIGKSNEKLDRLLI